MLAVSVILVIVCFLLSTSTASEAIGPVSTAVKLEEEVKFNCSGEAVTIVWTINSISVELLGLEATVLKVEGVALSNLTVVASAQYDAASIQCALVVSLSTILPLPPAVLTVLGIGSVASISFSDNCIQWLEPLFTSSDINELVYNVSLSKVGLSPLNVTTNKTQYCTELTPCQEYVVTVTPFSTFPKYTAASNSATHTTPEDYPYFEGPCAVNVEFEDSELVTCLFSCPVIWPEISCTIQYLHIIINSYSSSGLSEVVQNKDVSPSFVEDVIVQDVSGLPARKKFRSNFTLIGWNGVAIDGIVTTFSTYSVQSAKFDHLNNSVNVTCIFAINASASACWIVFINSYLELMFDGLIQHLQPQSSGVIAIPKHVVQHKVLQLLGSAAFDVKVYDMSMNGNVTEDPAFEQEEALVIEAILPSPNLSPSVIVSSSTTVVVQPSSPVEQNLTIGVGIGASMLMVSMYILLLLAICYCYKNKREKRETSAVVTANAKFTANKDANEVEPVYIEVQ